MSKTKFRFNAQNVFLTYSQVPVTWDTDYVIQKLTAIKPMHQYVVGREKHEDGNPHYHVYIKYATKVNTVNERYFDIDEIHPNIQVCKSPIAVVKYVTKGGDYKTNMSEEEFAKYVGEKKVTKDDVYREAQELETREEALNHIRQNLPRDAWIYDSQIESKARKLFPEPKRYVPKYTEFVVPAEVDEWLKSEFYPSKDRRRALILVSPPYYGKTHWARSLGHHMYFRSMFNWEEWDPTAKYIVMDDFDYEYLLKQQVHILKPLLAADGQMTVTDKYVKKMTIDQDKPVIVLMNVEDYNLHFSRLPEAIRARIRVVHLHKSLVPEEMPKPEKVSHPLYIHDNGFDCLTISVPLEYADIPAESLMDFLRSFKK